MYVCNIDQPESIDGPTKNESVSLHNPSIYSSIHPSLAKKLRPSTRCGSHTRELQLHVLHVVVIVIARREVDVANVEPPAHLARDGITALQQLKQTFS
mmetsp:Transcript_9784/g.23874  ORF Transcript_9784/g.23874 Transcript_9784/m.23874 type:complete len:98 (+) Transcript_9784:69-362(+)